MGHIAAHSTTESGDVGLVNHLTLGAAISNNFGTFSDKTSLIGKNDNWGNIGPDEALIPFVNQMGSDRLVIARTHRAQTIPVKDAEPPLVATGAEYILPQLASSKFNIRGTKAGKVIDLIPDNVMVVEYKDGSREAFDINPRYSTTKRNTTIRIELKTLNVGDTFEQGEMVAWSQMFNGDCLVQGKNVKIAIMNYLGASYEDGYCISETMSNSFEAETVIKIPVIIPKGTNILNFRTEKGDTKNGDTLVEFEYKQNLDEYIKDFDIDALIDFDPDEVDEEFQASDLMTKSSNGIKTISPGGELIDIKIKINNLAEADPVIVRHWKTLVKDIKLRQKEIQKYTPEQAKYLDNSDLTVLRTSRHKFKNNEFEGALIEFYLRVPKNLQMGDKISSRFGAKGVITKIIEKDKIPSAAFTGNIDIFLSPSGVIGRRNTAILKELYLGKILYFMKDVFAEMSKKGDMEKVKKLMLKVYGILDVTKDKSIVKSVEEYLKNTNDKKLQSLLVAKELNINYIIPPFNTMEFDKIQEAANLLDIPLNEKVYIPELDMWTKTEVPVGIQYVTRHEQLSDDYASTRSVGKYTQFGQATKGKSNQGGQSLGNLDVYAILTYDVPDLLKELMVSRSDNMKSKIKLISSIREKGSYRLEKTDIENSTTNVIKNILMKGIGLKMM